MKNNNINFRILVKLKVCGKVGMQYKFFDGVCGRIKQEVYTKGKIVVKVISITSSCYPCATYIKMRNSVTIRRVNVLRLAVAEWIRILSSSL